MGAAVAVLGSVGVWPISLGAAGSRMSRNCTPVDQKANSLFPLSNGQALWLNVPAGGELAAGLGRAVAADVPVGELPGPAGSVISMMRRSPCRPWLKLNE